MFIKRIKNYLIFVFFRIRLFTRRKSKEIAAVVRPGDKILEIGSGWKDKNGKLYFSAQEYFKDKAVEFVTSDANPAYGHRQIDVATLMDDSIFDHILCFHVLDDVYDWQKGIMNLYRALKVGGSLHIILPSFSPLDVPADYYRFTEKLIREFCRRNNWEIKKVDSVGSQRFPTVQYYEILRNS